jgi:uncharacterized protein YutE (UPF0331/DUF86 family)
VYFVDREKIESTLQYLEVQIHLFRGQQDWTSPLEKAALERLCQMMIESILDVGNSMIDGFIMRDPGSYEDIIDILIDEKVISGNTGGNLKLLIQYRKNLVQDYLEIPHQELQEQFSQYLHELESFTINVRGYLVNELGPVSAFRN